MLLRSQQASTPSHAPESEIPHANASADAHVDALQLSLTAADAFARRSLDETMASQEAVLTELARAYGEESNPTFAHSFLSASDVTYSQYVQNQHYGKSDQAAKVFFRLGQGLTITSEAILHKNQDYGFSSDAITRELQRICGAKKLVVVKSLADEPTAHVDMFLTFVDPVTVVVGQYSDPDDPNAAVLDEVARQLSEMDHQGQRLHVHRVPMPKRGDNHFRTYTNVVFANGVLLVPSYAGHESLESEVRDTYQQLLPNWDIVFIDCSRIIELDGALHCLTANLGS
ncbi:agmatine deiminase family protein [Planctomycetes bacterium TBK1r]|uniref:agmatine deiminase family protein n=1 Tax=Stieleria magnilauensis TaxID=2527963 RepID=UPI0011A2A4FB